MNPAGFVLIGLALGWLLCRQGNIDWYIVNCRKCGSRCATLTPEEPTVCAWWHKHCHAEVSWMKECDLAAGHAGPHQLGLEDA